MSSRPARAGSVIWDIVKPLGHVAYLAEVGLLGQDLEGDACLWFLPEYSAF